MQMMVLAAVALPAIAAAAYGAVRSQLFAAGVLLLVFGLTDAVRDGFDLVIPMGSFNVYAMDLVLSLFAILVIFRLLTVPIGSVQIWCLVLGLLLTFHVARGVTEFGLQEALNSSRSWLYFIIPLLFAATVPVAWDIRVWRLIALSGLTLALLSVPYLVKEGVHSASTFIDRNGELVTSRPIVSAGALIILQAAVLFLALRWPSRRASIWFALACIAGVLVLQHRTVWAAALAVAIVGFVSWSRSNVRRTEGVVFGVTGALLLVSPLALMGIWSSGSFRESLTEVTKADSTFSWRMQSWHELVAEHHSVGEVLFGAPAGESWARTIAGSTVTVSPHSAFVEAFLRFGAPGVLIFMGLFVVIWLRRRSISSGTSLTPNAIGLIVIGQLLFSGAYTLSAIQGLLLGVCVAALAPVGVRSPRQVSDLVVDQPVAAVP